jgi:hypothetical protein
MRALLIAGAAVLLLSACASETEIAQKNCAAAGFQEGTNEYAECVRKDVDLYGRRSRFPMRLVGLVSRYNSSRNNSS